MSFPRSADARRRREDLRLLTGAGRFVDDHRPHGCAALAVLRSPVASGAIRRLDVEAARRAPGVLLVLTAPDLGPAGRRLPLIVPHPGLRHPVGVAPLAAERVTFVGGRSSPAASSPGQWASSSQSSPASRRPTVTGG